MVDHSEKKFSDEVAEALHLTSNLYFGPNWRRHFAISLIIACSGVLFSFEINGLNEGHFSTRRFVMNFMVVFIGFYFLYPLIWRWRQI